MGHKWDRNIIIIIIIIIISSSSVQPLGLFWQKLEPSQATGMALARCILGKFLEVGCHCFLLPSDVPTFCRQIFRPKNPTASGGSEPSIVGTRGQHANH
jgi:hypothetical protein